MLRHATSLAIFAATATSATAAPPAFHDAVAADGPILWYQLNEAAGSTTVLNHGSLGPAYNGTCFNGVTLGVGTSSGDTGASFDAAGHQYIESGAVAPSSMLGNPTFTAETVVRVSAAPLFIYPPFLHWGAPSTGHSVYFSLWTTAPNRVYAGFYNGGLRGTCTFNNSAWAHIVWVRDSAGGANGQYQGTTVYINGAPVALEPDTALPGAPVIDVTATTFRVQRATDFDRYFSGVMDEVVLYPTALSPGQVRAHFRTLGLPACGADFDGHCGVNIGDFLAFLAAYAGGNARCDINLDGRLDIADFLAYLAAYAEGC
jgi:hypothetical protein